MVADAIFLMIGVVGVGGTEQTTQVLIVLRVLILVPDDEPDGASRRLPFKDAAEQFHLVCFLSRCGDMALSRTAAVQFLLDECQVDIHTRRHPVDDTSDGLTVTLAKGRQPEYIPKCIHFFTFLPFHLSMAVSAASFVATAAIAAVVTTVVSMMSAALTAACQHLDQMLYLFFRCLTVLLHLSHEVQFLASQRVVGVDGDAVVLDFHYLSHKLMVFGIVHRDDGSLEDMLVVELAVDAEDVTLQLVDALRDIIPESFITVYSWYVTERNLFCGLSILIPYYI